MKKIVFIFLVFSSIIFAQDYNDAAYWIFFGRQASAKTESMGRIVSLDFDKNFLSQSNPASLNYSNGLSLFYSYSNKYYIIKDMIFHFGGFAYNSKKFGAFAFNAELINWGKFTKTTEFSPEVVEKYTLTDQLYTFTYSNNIYDWFSLGVNANILRLSQGTDNAATTTFFDVGFLRKFNFLNNLSFRNNLTIGLQLKNIFKQNITVKDKNGVVLIPFNEVNVLPSISNLGISYEIEYFNKDLWINAPVTKITLGTEYQFLLNSKYRSAYKFGGEIALLDIFYMRLGYYKEKLNAYGCSNCLDYVKDTTYGFGLKIDFIKMFQISLPLIVKIDYVNIPQPTYVDLSKSTSFIGVKEWDNLNTISLKINYNM